MLHVQVQTHIHSIIGIMILHDTPATACVHHNALQHVCMHRSWVRHSR